MPNEGSRTLTLPRPAPAPWTASGLRHAGFAAIGTAIPDRVLTNADLEKMVDTSDEWIRARTGIRERRIAAPDVAASDLAAVAAERALERAALRAEDVDLIIVATVTGDMPFPATACFVQERIGARRAAAMDIGAACPGFIYGVATGAQFIATGMYDTVLVVGVEVLSRIVDWQDRNTCVLFGDAAGAAVLRPAQPGHGVLSIVLASDGAAADLLTLPCGGSRRPASRETVEQRGHYLKMNGAEVFKIAVRSMGDAALEAMRKAGLGRDDVDLLVPHQANRRIIDATVRRLGLPMERVMVNVDRYGNTSSASIPIALEEAIEQGRLKDGDRVIAVAFGAGMVWGALAVRWGLGE